MIVPTMMESNPRVAELVTCQKTLLALAPLMSFTSLDVAVIRLDVAWKTHTEVGSPPPSRVSVPARFRMTPPEV